jgi:hypothetical protein
MIKVSQYTPDRPFSKEGISPRPPAVLLCVLCDEKSRDSLFQPQIPQMCKPLHFDYSKLP